jgi:hypothetical protein
MNTDIAENTGQLTDADLPKQALTPIAQEDIEEALTNLRAFLSGTTGGAIFSVALRENREKESNAVTLGLTTLGVFPDRLEEFFIAKLKEQVSAYLRDNGMALRDADYRPEEDADFERDESGWELRRDRLVTAEEVVATVREQMSNAFGLVMYSFGVVSKGNSVRDIEHAEARFSTFGCVPLPVFDLYVAKAEDCVLRLLSDADTDDTGAAADTTREG